MSDAFSPAPPPPAPPKTGRESCPHCGEPFGGAALAAHESLCRRLKLLEEPTPEESAPVRLIAQPMQRPDGIRYISNAKEWEEYWGPASSAPRGFGLYSDEQAPPMVYKLAETAQASATAEPPSQQERRVFCKDCKHYRGPRVIGRFFRDEFCAATDPSLSPDPVHGMLPSKLKPRQRNENFNCTLFEPREGPKPPAGLKELHEAHEVRWLSIALSVAIAIVVFAAVSYGSLR